MTKISALRDVAEGLRNPLARYALDVWYFTAQVNRSPEFKYLTTLLWVELERGIPFCEAAKERLSERGTMLVIDRYDQKPIFFRGEASPVHGWPGCSTLPRWPAAGFSDTKLG